MESCYGVSLVTTVDGEAGWGMVGQESTMLGVVSFADWLQGRTDGKPIVPKSY